MVSADIPPVLPAQRSSRLRRVSFSDIPPDRWAELYALSPTSTPFSAWTFHRAWWDAYGTTASEHYLVWNQTAGDDPHTGSAAACPIDGIVPLMAREHRVPGSDSSSTTVPGGAAPEAVAWTTRTMYFAASYHADYASVLVPARHLVELASDLAAHLGDLLRHGQLDAVDLRRLPEGDPLPRALIAAWEREGSADGVYARVEPEDVCPVVNLRGDWHAQLASLGKKTRHEIRRKLRRAERAGPVALRYLPLDAAAVDSFIRLHQARWGSAGLFAASEDGDRSRLFLRRLAELEAASATPRFHLGEVSVAGRVVYALAGFHERGTCYFYNAGLDPDARDLSPGIVGTAAYLRDRIERGEQRFDFLRGNEPYKYEWGAEDTRLDRLVATWEGTGPTPS